MMPQGLLPTILSALLWTQAARADSVDEFVGSARIQVLNITSFWDDGALDSRIGCINAAGMLTLDDCAVFTRFDASPNTLYTKAGNCTFQNPNMPMNTDSIYGQNTPAWWCGERGDWPMYEEWYYTLNGQPYPFVCTGNIRCFFDVKAVVPVAGDALPIWTYFWGSQQMDIEAGHWRVTLLWERVDKE
ncbi:hypothetical protein C8A01DRAFT_17861 [Parachaetomium inaequale]|uniref:Uncharacterized protein n=1 Tax=Parachaetomium inaequale TaxID=2588326 RepID=A0AAN6SPM7_9PEZI|nr:hypothetical protein C8A01DRAFT_17861 [Parachaetomium inaequale]